MDIYLSLLIWIEDVPLQNLDNLNESSIVRRIPNDPYITGLQYTCIHVEEKVLEGALGSEVASMRGFSSASFNRNVGLHAIGEVFPSMD